MSSTPIGAIMQPLGCSRLDLGQLRDVRRTMSRRWLAHAETLALSALIDSAMLQVFVMNHDAAI